MSEIDLLVAGTMGDLDKDFNEETEEDEPHDILNETSRSYRLERTQSMAKYYESQEHEESCCMNVNKGNCTLF